MKSTVPLPSPIDRLHGACHRWLGDEYDLDAIDVVVAAAAVERMTGDPLWVLVVSGPGAAKTETVQPLAGAGATIGLPQALTSSVLSRLAATGLVPEGARLAEIHGTYSTVLQVMSSALVSPFKDEAWTDAFKELLAGLTHYPDFGRLQLDLKAMQAEVKAAAEAWYAKARGL